MRKESRERGKPEKISHFFLEERFEELSLSSQKQNKKRRDPSKRRLRRIEVL